MQAPAVPTGWTANSLSRLPCLPPKVCNRSSPPTQTHTTPAALAGGTGLPAGTPSTLLSTQKCLLGCRPCATCSSRCSTSRHQRRFSSLVGKRSQAMVRSPESGLYLHARTHAARTHTQLQLQPLPRLSLSHTHTSPLATELLHTTLQFHPIPSARPPARPLLPPPRRFPGCTHPASPLTSPLPQPAGTAGPPHSAQSPAAAQPQTHPA